MSEDVKPEVIKKTQDLLGKYFKKPPLTEKLLRKPPFRFIQDIIIAIIKETKFLDGLFTAEELSMDIAKDKEAKLAYLTKLIDVVKLITGINLTVRATKIISGHEPTKTNELLQAIGRALDKNTSSKEAIMHYKNRLEKKSDSKKPTSKEGSSKKLITETSALVSKEASSKKPITDTSTRLAKHANKEPRKTESEKRKTRKVKSQEPEPKEKLREKKMPKPAAVKDKSLTEASMEKVEQSAVEVPPEKDIGNDSTDLIIKKTPDSAKVHQPKNIIPKADELVNLTKLNQSNEDSGKQTEFINRLDSGKYAEFLKHDESVKVQNSLVRDNTVSGKLRETNLIDVGGGSASVANIIVEKSEQKDEAEDMVVIETKKGSIFESTARKEIDVTEEHGYLVAQILKTEQELVSRNSADNPNRKVEIVWQTGIVRDRESIVKAVDNLRNLIQTLITYTNPMGKILDYLQGDIEIMQKEVMDYRNQYATVNKLLEDERIQTDKFMHNMKESLEDIEANVYDQLNKIYQVKINISKNEHQIQRLLNDCA
ncbi:TRAF3-interacting protein 1 [Belonocnema kinseyi]|uniref:TRAF3-interacting protein 1 n=1 Tax=Belonocnema kinseyi TaxID=2817044 RepID=UPI00143DE240|nr:TRAF3-interacting protein 1 [Belonocnema kinseyi]